MVGVILCSKARFFSAASTLSTSAISRSAARASCTLRQVSSTSEEVMPWCTKRASGPTISARWVRKAMTSCLVSRSISSIRATSKVAFLPLAQIVFGGFLGDHAEFGLRIRRMGLDLEPDLETGLGFPDRGHFRAGVAGDHRRLTAQMRIPQKWGSFCSQNRRKRLITRIFCGNRLRTAPGCPHVTPALAEPCRSAMLASARVRCLERPKIGGQSRNID